ncbi:hypothetical protein GCM10023116_04990 [Kistimonas scapharcae]|uniref:GmrSD restriction endonucleases N-terminal domain-containing protein n=1 Tax=Kistimonas scapharcae TaxID=1036133 RepID=A0ABP8UXB0_9GAMM
MSNQIKPSVTSPTIADIYQDIESGKLVLRPDFQRKFVWTIEHQDEFIDTIVNGFPFPEIYVCQGDIDIKKLKTTQHVIDGQQRLTTIKKYIDGDESEKFKKVKPYSALSDAEREIFLSYQLVVRDIGKVSEETIKEVFRRINLTKFKLEDIEIHNAVYDGHFIQAAKDILSNVSLEVYGVFHDSELTRMADLYFVLSVMSTIEVGSYFPRENEVEKSIAKFNDEYPNKDHIKALLIKTFATINDIGLQQDSIWFRKSCFFTMVVELAKNNNVIPTDILTKLNDLETKILSDKNNNESEYGKFYSYMYSGTTSRKARIERANTFKSHVLS